MSGAEVLVPVTMFAGGFAMIFGIYYLKTRQNLAMIERNMNPKEFANRPAPYKNLKWALLLVGAGAGLLLAFIIDEIIFQNSMHDRFHYRPNVPIYFALIAIGGGMGLFGSYRIEKKWWDDNEDKVSTKDRNNMELRLEELRLRNRELEAQLDSRNNPL